MYEAPIVTEVRSAGQRLADEAEGDLHILFQRLREVQKQYPERWVQVPRHPYIKIDDFHRTERHNIFAHYSYPQAESFSASPL